jgi:gas vesicle protein
MDKTTEMQCISFKKDGQRCGHPAVREFLDMGICVCNTHKDPWLTSENAKKGYYASDMIKERTVVAVRTAEEVTRDVKNEIKELVNEQKELIQAQTEAVKETVKESAEHVTNTVQESTETVTSTIRESASEASIPIQHYHYTQNIILTTKQLAEKLVNAAFHLNGSDTDVDMTVEMIENGSAKSEVVLPNLEKTSRWE